MVKKSQMKRPQRVRVAKKASAGIGLIAAAVIAGGTVKSLWTNHEDYDRQNAPGASTTTTTEAPPATWESPKTAQIERLAQQMLANPANPGPGVTDPARIAAAQEVGAYFAEEFAKAGDQAPALARRYAELALLADPGAVAGMTLAQLARVQEYQIGYNYFPLETQQKARCLVDEIVQIQAEKGIPPMGSPEHPLTSIARDNTIQQDRWDGPCR